jgi:hypothetical protein
MLQLEKSENKLIQIKPEQYTDLYNGVLDESILSTEILVLRDHLGGFDKMMHTNVLDYIESIGFDKVIGIEYIVDYRLKQAYKNFTLRFAGDNTPHFALLESLSEYNIHPIIDYKNFICSFNRKPHVSRQILVAFLNNQGYFDSNYCSKCFAYNNSDVNEQLEGFDMSDNEMRLFRKFLNNNKVFCESTIKFTPDNQQHLDPCYGTGYYPVGDIANYNISNVILLEDKLTQSFIHIVSETIATGYYPFITEKFLYSVVTRGLFLSYAQPLWHDYLEKYYGFKKYNKIFDYGFDKIENPIKRLVRLLEMISKFANLSVDDWHDLYHMEMDTIEFNYDHYFSKRYLHNLKPHE